MDPPVNTKSKIVPTEEQKNVLRMYRNDLHLISTRQHDLISRCEVASGLPTKYIKNWIGNENSKARGKRRGGSQYRPPGKPRVLSGYNIFCQETSPPDSVSSQGMAARNRWWGTRWSMLSQKERAVYNARAAEISKLVATHSLTGDALKCRREYLLRQLVKVCDDLSVAGVEVAAYAMEEGEEPLFTGSPIGIKFSKSRKRRSTYLCTQFEHFVEYEKQIMNATQAEDEAAAESSFNVEAAPARSNHEPSTVSPTQPALVVSSPAALVSSTRPAVLSSTPLAGTISSTKPAPKSSTLAETVSSSPSGTVPSTVSGNGLSTQAATPANKRPDQTAVKEGAPEPDFVGDVNQNLLAVQCDSIPELDNSQGLLHSLNVVVNTTSGPAASVTLEKPVTALDILLPMSNGEAYDEPNGMDTPNLEKPTACKIEPRPDEKSVKRPSKKRKISGTVGRRIDHLWVMEGTDGTAFEAWYSGTVVQQCGQIYQVKYDGEDTVWPITVTAFNKAVKAQTLRFL